MKTHNEQTFAMEETDERFESGAREYAEYLRTVEGRLRLDIAWENFRAALAEADDSTADDSTDTAPVGPNKNISSGVQADGPHGARGFALDLGCGTGALSVRLARGLVGFRG